MEWINILGKEAFANLRKNIFLQEFYFMSLIFISSYNLVSFVFSFFTMFSSISFLFQVPILHA